MHPHDYVRRWFLPFVPFCARIGGPPHTVRQLIAAGALPGAIYAGQRDSGHGWWSALGGDPDILPHDAEQWFAPAAVWWGRRALLCMLNGGSIDTAVRANQTHFVADFVDALRAEPLAPGAFPDAFPGGVFDTDAATRCALTEWSDWTKGGYAVCLARFSGESCVRKEALARRLRRHFEGEPGFALSRHTLFDLVERLEAMLLPFAPWQRATCTPGRVIDPALAALNLGNERPYG
ncbi:MAG: DUF6058 family natural product biosynthesis protein [Sphingomonas sp.]